MSITKADLLLAVNGNLERDETDIDRQINRVLFKVSNHKTFLADIKTTDTIDSDTVVINVPDFFKKLDNIRLLDTDNNVFSNYLDHISYTEYLGAQFASHRSIPNQYSLFNRQIYFFPVPSKEFTVHISYFKIHPPTPDSISFDDRFLNVMESGSTYEVAYNRGVESQIQLWGQRYADDLRDVEKYALSPTQNTRFNRF